MEDKQWQPLGVFQPAGMPALAAAVDAAGRLTRRLIPFPGSEAAEGLPATVPPLFGGMTSGASSTAAAIGQAPAAIVAEAASILDEEMARGVLSARNLGAPSSAPQPEGSQAMLRQMHDFIDQLAAAWPTMQGAFGHAAAPAHWAQPGSGESPICELKPASPVRRTQRAVITMTVTNEEDRDVVLVPMVTDLLSQGGDRIPAQAIELTPRELRLRPGAQQTVQLSVLIPAAAMPACYSGLIVVKGIDGLRALLTIETV